MNDFNLTNPSAQVETVNVDANINLCNALYGRSQEALKKGIWLAVALGQELVRTKGKLPKGTFKNSFKKTTSELGFTFSYRQAAKYMKVYELLKSKLDASERLPFVEALQREDWEAVQKVVEKKLPGVTSIKLALVALDDSPKEKCDYSPVRTNENMADENIPAPTGEALAVASFNAFAKGLTDLETVFVAKAANIDRSNRVMLAGQLRELADKLISM